MFDFINGGFLQAEDNILRSKLDKEYSAIGGNADFCKLSCQLALGDSAAQKEGATATVQSISGTGALRIGGAFFNAFFPGAKEIFLPTPTWGNHIPIFQHSGLKVSKYSYYDAKTCGFDFEGALRDINVCIFFYEEAIEIVRLDTFFFFLENTREIDNPFTCLCPQSDRSRSEARTVGAAFAGN